MANTREPIKDVLPHMLEDPLSGQIHWEYAKFNYSDDRDVTCPIHVKKQGNQYFIESEQGPITVFLNTPLPQYKYENGEEVSCDTQIIRKGYQPFVLHADGAQTRVWLANTAYERGLELRKIPAYKAPKIKPLEKPVYFVHEAVSSDIPESDVDSFYNLHVGKDSFGDLFESGDSKFDFNDINDINDFDSFDSFDGFDNFDSQPFDTWIAPPVSPLSSTHKMHELLAREKPVLIESNSPKKARHDSTLSFERRSFGIDGSVQKLNIFPADKLLSFMLKPIPNGLEQDQIKNKVIQKRRS